MQKLLAFTVEWIIAIAAPLTLAAMVVGWLVFAAIKVCELWR